MPTSKVSEAVNTAGMVSSTVPMAASCPLIQPVGSAGTAHSDFNTSFVETNTHGMFPAPVDNSPFFNAHRMKVPFLLEAGDDDGTVAWYQSIGLWNIARRAKRNVVRLIHMGEGHGLMQAENQRDYPQRILAWFGHYQKGEPAILLTGCSGLTVDHDLDSDANFRGYASGAGMEMQPHPELTDLQRSRVRSSIESALSAKRMERVRGEPNFWVGYQVILDEQVSLHN